jgi:osmotically-inducible protein OsmY
MKLNLKLFGIALLLLGGVVACDKPGPAESAGKKIDQTADDASRKLGAAADKVTEKLGEQNAKASVALDDAEITARVKASFFAEPGLKTLQISVDTVKGVVTLTGSVDTPENKTRAKDLAAAVAGVKDVDNKLVPMSPK